MLHHQPPIPISVRGNLTYRTPAVCSEIFPLDSNKLAVVPSSWAFVDSTCMPYNFRLKQLLLVSQLINHLLATVIFHALQDNIG